MIYRGYLKLNRLTARRLGSYVAVVTLLVAFTLDVEVNLPVQRV